MNSRDLKAAIEKITQRGGLSNVGMWSVGFRSFYLATVVLFLSDCLLMLYTGRGKNSNNPSRNDSYSICIFSKVLSRIQGARIITTDRRESSSMHGSSGKQLSSGQAGLLLFLFPDWFIIINYLISNFTTSSIQEASQCPLGILV